MRHSACSRSNSTHSALRSSPGRTTTSGASFKAAFVSGFHRDRHARFGNELLRGLVEANQRTIAVAWPRIDGQHVFHSGYERAVGLRRDDPVLAAMGL